MRENLRRLPLIRENMKSLIQRTYDEWHQVKNWDINDFMRLVEIGSLDIKLGPYL